MDFKTFDPKFSNQLELEGPEFSEIQSKQEAFVNKYNGEWCPRLSVPLDIKGLTLRTSEPLPATRFWWRKTSSFERNGFFNWHTHVLNTKFIPIFTVFFLLYGWMETPFHGYLYEQEEDNGERRNLVYDKLAPRTLPLMKVTSRPS